MALKDNIVSYWKMDESAGSSRADSFGGNTLTDHNTVGTTTGKVGNCGQFTAASSMYLNHTDNAALSMGDIDMTMMAWVQISDKSVDRIICGKWDTSANNREYLLLYKQSVDQFQFTCTSEGTGAGGFGTINASFAGSPSLNTWYLVIAWHDSVANNTNITVNAGATNSSGYSLGIFNGTSDLVVGRNDNAGSPGNYWNGLIDEVAIWKRVLTSAERTQLYNSGNGLAFDSIDVIVSNELYQGPPLRGAPWLQRLPIEPSRFYSPPGSHDAVGGDLIYAPEVSVGPIAHAPWMGSRLLITDGLKVPPYGGAAPPVVLPVGPGTGKKKNFLRRAPSRIQSPERQKLREAQNADFLHNLVNSLIRQGVLFQTSAGEWILRGGGFSEPRKPLATDDRTRGMNIGNTWIDSSEQSAWVCISNAENAAVWKRITSPVADGQYTVGLGVSTDGKLTLADGGLTKIQGAT